MKKILYYFKIAPIRILTELYGLYYGFFGKIGVMKNQKGFKRIYFYHIMKTAGTSINKMFLSLHYDDYDYAYGKLSQTPKLRIENENFSYCCWNKNQLLRGRYNYAFSHHPFHSISLPKNTYTFTVFRDPIKRVVSLYKMYLDYYEIKRVTIDKYNVRKHPGDTLIDFINKVDDSVLMGQLYFFSKTFNYEEAINNVRSLDTCFFIENFDRGIDKLNFDLNLKLEPLYVRKSGNSYSPKEGEIEFLRKKITKEIEFMEAIKAMMD